MQMNRKEIRVCQNESENLYDIKIIMAGDMSFLWKGIQERDMSGLQN